MTRRSRTLVLLGVGASTLGAALGAALLHASRPAVRAAKTFYVPYAEGPWQVRRPNKTSDSFLIRQSNGNVYLYNADKDELAQLETQAWDAAEGKIWRVQRADKLPIHSAELFLGGRRQKLAGERFARGYLSADRQYVAVLSSGPFEGGWPGWGQPDPTPPFFHELFRLRGGVRIGPAVRLPFQEEPFVFWSSNNAFVIYRYRDQVCILRGRSGPPEKEK